ncbi:8510_t:CDS:1, partial [Cetraspora pellucida]
TITNCFYHTGLFDYKITAFIYKVYPNKEDSSVLTKLKESLKMLSFCYLISLAHYTNPSEEIDLIYQEFTDANLLALTTPENDNDADSINNSNSSFIASSNFVKLNAIYIVISLLDTIISNHNAVFRILHLLQQDIQLQVFFLKVQATLGSFIQVEYQIRVLLN